jgi:hypothetical protein
MRKFVTKKRVLAAGVVGALLAGGAAYAYFTGTSGTGSGQAHTGTSAAWSVSVGAFAGGPMYPGSGVESATYTITNANTGNQALTAVSASVNADTNGDITENGTALTGCQASWYAASAGAPASGYNVAIAKQGTTTGTVSVQLNESGSNQNVCRSAQPDVTVTAS